MLPQVRRFRNWLRRRSPHASTAHHYSRDLELFFAWLGKPPSDVTLHDIDRYIEHCQTDLGHAIATVNRRLCALHSFYEFLAVDTPDAPPNPVLPRRHYVRQGRRLPRDVEDEVVEKLFAVIDDVRDRAMFLLMLRCGLRSAEVRDLSLGDLYLQPTPGNLPRIWVRGKNGSHRVVYLSAQTLDTLQDWLAVRPQVEDQAVFLSRLKKRLTTTAIRMRIIHYRRLAGVEVSCHQLRHCFGRHMVEEHVPLGVIRELMGHRWLRTTILYTHISDQQVQANYDAAAKEIGRRLSLEGEGQ
jgi:site-specific recombinase XerC